MHGNRIKFLMIEPPSRQERQAIVFDAITLHQMQPTSLAGAGQRATMEATDDNSRGDDMGKRRQKILVLYLKSSALDSPVASWALYDGTGKENHTTGDGDTPPYETGLDALKDGWRVIQFPQLIPPYPGLELTTSFQHNEFIFEQLEDI
jgi:hypothetical protein